MGRTSSANRVLLTCALLVFPSVALGQVDEAATGDPATDAADRTRQVDEARGEFEQAAADYRAGRLEAARRGFERAYGLLPSAELAFNLARVCEQLGRSAEAIAYYERYLAGHDGAGKGTASKPERVRLRRRIERLRQQRKAREAMLKLPPPRDDQLLAEARRFFERGVKLYEDGHFAGAFAAFSAAFAMAHTPELYFNLGLTSERLGRTQDALAYYQAYLSAVPQAQDRERVQARIAALRSGDQATAPAHKGRR